MKSKPSSSSKPKTVLTTVLSSRASEAAEILSVASPETSAASKAIKKATNKPRSSLNKFERLGLLTPNDLILHLPIRYEDETRIATLDQATPGEHIQFEGEIVDSQATYQPRRQLVAHIYDGQDTIQLRWLNFYPSQVQQMQPGRRWRVRGEVRAGFHGLEIIQPKVTQADAPLSASLTPIYPTTEGLTQPSIRKAIAEALEKVILSDTLDDATLQGFNLMPFAQAIKTIHHPTPADDENALLDRTHPAWVRLKFDELLAQQLSLAAARQARQNKLSTPLPPSQPKQGLIAKLLKTLPFHLTAAQRRVSEEIAHDLNRPFPMHRLLQGDVGSGKTIVAMLAALQAVEQGHQVAVMAPTEILAAQHFEKFNLWSSTVGVTCVVLTGSVTTKQRREVNAAIESGQAQIVVGTQALIQEAVNFTNLSLVIVDEQHRFGVGQRLALNLKGLAFSPHQLSMSATPIPRTLAMTFFADLDVSVIDELPPGRKPIRTKLVKAQRRDEVLAAVASAIQEGGQAYWVCPLVQESEALELQTAVDTFEALQTALPHLTIGLVHGKLPNEEKATVMAAFKAGHIKLLVATTVIEVGVDVPNASMMVIEHAERFGLAQLHQLRGRVGRGERDSICVLLFEDRLSIIARERLRALYETQDGFEISQRDLSLRGPGEFLGARQSGVALLRFADYQADALWVERARDTAVMLRRNQPETAAAHIKRWMQNRQDYLLS